MQGVSVEATVSRVRIDFVEKSNEAHRKIDVGTTKPVDR